MDRPVDDISRYEFLRLAGLGIASCAMPLRGWGYESLPPLAVRRISLSVGAQRPFRLLHVSDSHIARIDSRDGDSLHAFARSRSRIGRELGEYYLGEAVHHARMTGIRILHTGDFMDFRSEANLEYAERRIRTDRILACVGNHEYWLDADKKETEEYKATTIPRLKGVWEGVSSSVVCIDGVNFFLFDNSFGTVTEVIAARFDDAAKAGLPIVMACHVPLWAEGCGIGRHVCGLPAAKGGDSFTSAFVERVRREPLVRAVLCGHLHRSCEFDFSPSAREFVANALFKGEAAEVCFS